MIVSVAPLSAIGSEWCGEDKEGGATVDVFELVMVLHTKADTLQLIAPHP
jgi:hypothetical protein